MTHPYRILGIAAPYIDHIMYVDEMFIEMIGGDKGGSHNVGHEGVRAILDSCGYDIQTLPGGSAHNTLKGLTRLGHACAATSMIGRDQAAKLFLESLDDYHITSLYVPTDTPTSQTVCMITPDGERTFRAFHGACNEMRGCHLNRESFEGIKLLHIEGYAMYNGDLVETAMRYAKEAGAKISIDLASFELTKKFREPLMELLLDYVNIVFCNEDEARALVAQRPEQACRTLQKLVDIAVVSVGVDGCWVGEKGAITHCPAHPVEATDTCGAGDLFAAGFLHGLLEGMPLHQAAQIGAILGAAVVQCTGATITDLHWPQALEQIHQIGSGDATGTSPTH